ncbi:MAG: RNA polymerase sigma factor [Sphingomonas sp.]
MEADRSWIVARFLPFEGEVRRWLRQTIRGRYDESDIIQESYYRIWRSADHEEVEVPRAYFFKVVRNILIEQIRRDQVVQISALTEIDVQSIACEEPRADRLYAGRSRLLVVQRLIEELPDRCRKVMRLRKIEAKSQRETAALLGVTENVVEKEVARGLRLLLRRIGELEADETLERRNESGRGRSRERG